MKKIIKWSGYNWITQERWGDIHPDKLYNWYDPSAVEVVGERLGTKNPSQS
jgi:hypothetical protein